VGCMLIAVPTLALGIGATAGVFSLIQGVLLTHRPYRQPEKLVPVHSLSSDGQPSGQGWAALQWTHWQQQAKSLEGATACDWTFNFRIGNDGSDSMQGNVSPPWVCHPGCDQADWCFPTGRVRLDCSCK